VGSQDYYYFIFFAEEFGKLGLKIDPKSQSFGNKTMGTVFDS
jgi:hypothetical protein